MSKVTEQLREFGIFNPIGFYGTEPFVSIFVQTNRRTCIPSAVCVTKRGVNLGAAWYDHGSKRFSYGSREDKKEQLEAAKEWASDKFGITQWMRDPFGSYGSADFVKTRLKQLLKQVQR